MGAEGAVSIVKLLVEYGEHSHVPTKMVIDHACLLKALVAAENDGSRITFEEQR